jgi:putative radical SAM enzyme (TIGR03279 family)
MSAPKVTAVADASPAARSGIAVGDELLSLNGETPRDVIEFQQLCDGDRIDIVVRRPGAPIGRTVHLEKEAGQPLGVEVSSAVFDRVRTCDNHCAFCFIYQLPKGMRKSLYLKDDDYRLSFLYGNFTTLTRFTELDLERVIDERLGPLFVSIHATDPETRAQILRNPKGATSLRWLRAILDAGIEVHGQVVVCPGINDGAVLEQTLVGVLDEYPRLATLGVVPLGLSRYSTEPEMREHTEAEAVAVCGRIEEWQAIYSSVLGRRLVYAADEYYLLAGRAFPAVETYDGFPQHENGIGMVRAFEAAFAGCGGPGGGVRHGFFASVDGAPASGYRAPRAAMDHVADEPGASGRIGVLTGAYWARVLARVVTPEAFPDVRIIEVENRFFGGNIGVAGLMTAEDLTRVLLAEPASDTYLLPDACLSEGRFLDGGTLADLPRVVRVVQSDGRSLRTALDALAPVGAGS